MRLTLSKIFVVPALALAAGLFASSARAAETITIPFEFTALGQSYPAGSYTVEQKPAQHIVTLRQVKGTASFNWMMGPGAQAADSHVLLNFAQSGNTHSLRSIQWGRRFSFGGQSFSTTTPHKAPVQP